MGASIDWEDYQVSRHGSGFDTIIEKVIDY
jgi:hypothetical protein